MRNIKSKLFHFSYNFKNIFKSNLYEIIVAYEITCKLIFWIKFYLHNINNIMANDSNEPNKQIKS